MAGAATDPAPRRRRPRRTADHRTTRIEQAADHSAGCPNTPGGRLVFHVFAALAEFIRELIVIGTKEGLAAARARGRVGGRPSVATEEIIRAARDLLPDPGRSITSIAELLGVSPGTLYNHIPDLRDLRAGAVPRQLEAPAR
ncbi:recombinase family protein [Streptomyces mirabilis]|uniref:recombinase family protein n=1 Tax=Streptomyces mirabilis TaxID=68239 RepID=UPI003721D267